MTSPDCTRFDTCSAPLCPLDGQSLEHGIWYPGEASCTLKAHASLPNLPLSSGMNEIQ